MGGAGDPPAPVGEGAEHDTRGPCAAPMPNMSSALRADCKVPSGTTENSPACAADGSVAVGRPRFQPWVTVEKGQSPRGERKCWRHSLALPSLTGLFRFSHQYPPMNQWAFLSPYWAGAHSKSCSTYFIAPINFTLSCASTKLVPTPRSGVCVKITQPPFALFPPVPS